MRTSMIIKLQAKNDNQAKIGDAIEQNMITSKTKEQHLQLCRLPIARAHCGANARLTLLEVYFASKHL